MECCDTCVKFSNGLNLGWVQFWSRLMRTPVGVFSRSESISAVNPRRSEEILLQRFGEEVGYQLTILAGMIPRRKALTAEVLREDYTVDPNGVYLVHKRLSEAFNICHHLATLDRRMRFNDALQPPSPPKGLVDPSKPRRQRPVKINSLPLILPHVEPGPDFDHLWKPPYLPDESGILGEDFWAGVFHTMGKPGKYQSDGEHLPIMVVTESEKELIQLVVYKIVQELDQMLYSLRGGLPAQENIQGLDNHITTTFDPSGRFCLPKDAAVIMDEILRVINLRIECEIEGHKVDCYVKNIKHSLKDLPIPLMEPNTSKGGCDAHYYVRLEDANVKPNLDIRRNFEISSRLESMPGSAVYSPRSESDAVFKSLLPFKEEVKSERWSEDSTPGFTSVKSLSNSNVSEEEMEYSPPTTQRSLVAGAALKRRDSPLRSQVNKTVPNLPSSGYTPEVPVKSPIATRSDPVSVIPDDEMTDKQFLAIIRRDAKKKKAAKMAAIRKIQEEQNKDNDNHVARKSSSIERVERQEQDKIERILKQTAATDRENIGVTSSEISVAVPRQPRPPSGSRPQNSYCRYRRSKATSGVSLPPIETNNTSVSPRTHKVSRSGPTLPPISPKKNF